MRRLCMWLLLFSPLAYAAPCPAGQAKDGSALVQNEHTWAKALEQRDFAATGDHVYATVRLVQAIRATGKTLEQPEVIHHFTFRNGKVVRCRVGEDTALTKAAFAR